jgi:tetratricopeptide (TPR) repeat protein
MHSQLSLIVVVVSAGAGFADHGAADGKAPILGNLGNRHHKVTTASADAQRYFDQGLTLCWSFNHPEAIRSFQRAAKLDPDCAMAHWGIAFALGTNINMPMMEEAVPKAYEAAQKALELAPKASPKEQAYIRAMAKRYAKDPPKDRAPLDKAFAEAMREVHKAYPDDLDAAVLFAEALMDTMPWAYWTEDGKPKPETAEMIEVLEGVMKKDPLHPGANHYYIHAVEASPTPERALAAAHRLRDLVPGSGHLVHMPSHIYLRTGQYHEASLCNERAIVADEAYIAKYKITGTYANMYYPHNIHFLWYSTGMEGRKADSLRAAKKVAGMITPEAMKAMPEAQWFKATAYLAPARFGEWEDVLREPAPDDSALIAKAGYHYARGLAHARRRELPEAKAELGLLGKVAADEGMKKLTTPNFPGEALVAVYRTVLIAEVAGADAKPDDLLKGLEEAVKLQDKLPYMEPPFFYYPLRQRLGAALVEMGRLKEAEAVYREDLKRNPENSWSLYGLMQCLRATARFTDAADVERRFRDAWKYADHTLTASAH